MSPVQEKNSNTEQPLTGLALRGVIGGWLMGLANLVPGISGGTMLLATGIYPAFVTAVAELTIFRFRLSSIVVLCSIVFSAALSILLLAGPIKDWVVMNRWPAYSLFIGLSLGGVPVILKMIGGVGKRIYAGVIAGIIVMTALAVIQQKGAAGIDDGESNIFLLFLAGLGGAGAMVLPGISGGYIFLLLGQYIPILSAVEMFREALGGRDLSMAVQPFLHVLLPVAVGIAAGVVTISNIIRKLLEKYSQITLGVLLGLLLGAVIGLWPFRKPVEPDFTEIINGKAGDISISMDRWPLEFFIPDAVQLFIAAALILAGFALTSIVARIGSILEKKSSTHTDK